MRIAPGDLTTRARIQRAAIERFGRDGFDVGLRGIAETAGVSLGLIRHHFGSKDGLRAACDTHVLEYVEHLMEEQAASTHLMATLGEYMRQSGEMSVYVHYMVRSLQSGGAFARDFLERLIQSTRVYLDAGVANGSVVPSIDPEARARFLTMASMGALLLEFTLSERDDPREAWDDYVRHATLPALELYSHGLLTDTTFLEAFLASDSSTTSSVNEADAT
ncbi:TetR/AcrR family transcriptional regulator [Aeromicrobium phragmitis]|uniref:TetR/AcrR family transcriptional regulator n=1 Tax=Aeromicrobium phragmitis TaxID=2478914 RepID=A0A3L8PI48_9ACTN|nr:TetR family transcriptional regulator [Aeromicrobium phragmitis]RLV54995.1 TetR/AcrR family transcriptional regulator [Aeromicrobium phragmitis]